MKLGLKPFVPRKTDLKFAKYRTDEALPARPAIFGHEDLITDWQMLGNNDYGDCVWAGAAHETMLWNAAGGKKVVFDDDSVLSDYSAVTGFDLTNPQNTDNGTDMHHAAKYRQDVGVVDASGARHKIGAYLFIDPNLDHILEAAWLFGICALGIKVPQSAMDQFKANQPWHVAPFFDFGGRSIIGGHYVPAVADRGLLQVVTWAKTQPVTTEFVAKYVDVGVVYVSEEMMTSGKSLEGFDLVTLQKDLQSLS